MHAFIACQPVTWGKLKCGCISPSSVHGQPVVVCMHLQQANQSHGQAEVQLHLSFSCCAWPTCVAMYASTRSRPTSHMGEVEVRLHLSFSCAWPTYCCVHAPEASQPVTWGKLRCSCSSLSYAWPTCCWMHALTAGCQPVTWGKLRCSCTSASPVHGHCAVGCMHLQQAASRSHGGSRAAAASQLLLCMANLLLDACTHSRLPTCHMGAAEMHLHLSFSYAWPTCCCMHACMHSRPGNHMGEAAAGCMHPAHGI
jgi:hypothetical protein